MKQLLILIILISSIRTASGQFSQENDTLCISLTEAKHLAFVKLEYHRLDTLTTKQAELIHLLDNALKQKQSIIDSQATQLSNLTAKTFLLEDKIEKYELENKAIRKKNFTIKVKWLSIGIGIGAILTFFSQR